MRTCMVTCRLFFRVTLVFKKLYDRGESACRFVLILCSLARKVRDKHIADPLMSCFPFFLFFFVCLLVCLFSPPLCCVGMFCVYLCLCICVAVFLACFAIQYEFKDGGLTGLVLVKN